MSLHRANGARVTAATITDISDPVASDPDPYVKITENLTHRSEARGADDSTANTANDIVRRSFKAGDVVRTSKVMAMLTPATVASVAPATGAAAGGTAITITGTDLDGVVSGTLGGTALTNVVVVNPRKVTATAPAHAAGLVNLVLADDSGAVTKTGAFTYA